MKHDRITPAQVVILGFLFQILIGACLLSLPVATQSGERVPFLDALFTATSATCVTGLVIHDTALFWSPFGQGVILLLIQVGGMGVVTMAVAIFMFFRPEDRSEAALGDAGVHLRPAGGRNRADDGIHSQDRFLIEAIGALLLALRFCPQFGLGKGIWYGIFHAVSAFCNAGFDLMGETGAFSSLTGYVGGPSGEPCDLPAHCGGGLGFLTWHDVAAHGRHVSQYRLQSKLILLTTLALLVGGFLFFRFYEFSRPQWAALTGGERGLAALFQSVSPGQRALTPWI